MGASTPALGQVLATTTNLPSQIHVYSPSTGQYLTPIAIPPVAPTGMAADDAGRRVFLTDGRTLWILPYDPPRTLRVVGTFNISEAMGGGLAYDAARGQLLGTGGLGISNKLYAIDAASAFVTLIAQLGNVDFGGIDYDVAGDRLVLANDLVANDGAVQGRGLYAWRWPYLPSGVTRLTSYPFKSVGVEERDIDGVGVGFGRVYLCTDELNWMYVYNLSTGQYETPVQQGGFGANAFSGGATVAPSLLVGGSNDLTVTISGAPPCGVTAGETFALTMTVGNAGTQGLTNVVLTCLAGGEVVSTQPAASPSPGGVSFTWAALAPGQSVAASANVRYSQAGNVTSSIQARCDQAEQDMTNNTASVTIAVLPLPPATAVAVGVVSTLGPSSLVPGLGGARFVPGFAIPRASANGQRWMMHARVDGLAASSQVMLAGDVAGGPPTVVARTGAFPAITGDLGPLPPVDIDTQAGVNNDGTYVWSGSDGRSPTVLTNQGSGLVFRGDGMGSEHVVARQGEPVPGIFNATYLHPRGGVSISGSGEVSFVTRVAGAGITLANDWVVLGEDGLSVLARIGSSVPSGQSSGTGTNTFFPLVAIEVNDPRKAFARDESSLRFSVCGRLGGSTVFPAPGGVDLAAMHSDIERGGLIVSVQENCPVAGLSPPVSGQDGGPVVACSVQADGGLIVTGRHSGGGKWVQMNGRVMARTGEFIMPASSERWSSVRIADAFVGAAAISVDSTTQGITAWVVAGATDNADRLRDQVAVLNGSMMLARENDPVDLNGDGIFNDDVMIASFVPFASFLTAQDWYAVVTLRTYAASLACSVDTSVGEALIRVPRPDAQPSCPADFNADGGVDGGDIEAFFIDWSVSGPASDVNLDGGVDGADVEYFFVAWVAGGC